MHKIIVRGIKSTKKTLCITCRGALGYLLALYSSNPFFSNLRIHLRLSKSLALLANGWKASGFYSL